MVNIIIHSLNCRDIMLFIIITSEVLQNKIFHLLLYTYEIKVLIGIKYIVYYTKAFEIIQFLTHVYKWTTETKKKILNTIRY